MKTQTLALTVLLGAVPVLAQDFVDRLPEGADITHLMVNLHRKIDGYDKEAQEALRYQIPMRQARMGQVLDAAMSLNEVNALIAKVQSALQRIDTMPVDFARVLIVSVPGSQSEVANPTLPQVMQILSDHRSYWTARRAEFQAQPGLEGLVRMADDILADIQLDQNMITSGNSDNQALISRKKALLQARMLPSLLSARDSLEPMLAPIPMGR